MTRSNDHARGDTTKADKRFCPPLLKLMIPYSRGEEKPFKMPKHVADGAE